MTRLAATMPDAMPTKHQTADELIESGNVQEAKGDLNAAYEKYVEATLIAPEYARAWLNLGIVLALKSKSNEAIEAYDRTLALEPASAPAHYNRGLALSRTGNAKLAEAAFTTALEHRPLFPDAYAALAGALEAQDRNDEAIRALNEALRQAPAHAGYTLNLGLLKRKTGKLDEAEALFRNACRNDPADAPAAHGLAAVLREKGKLAEACRTLEPMVRDANADVGACSSFLFTLLFRDDVLPQEIFARHAEVGASIQNRFPVQFTAHDNVRAASRRLRVGYVSGDFGRHAVAFFALPVIEGHDRRSFEVFCYSNADATDDVTEKFRNASDVWRDIHATDNANATQMVRDDAIDILVDLSGHTGKNRLDLFARKPSPIQVTWLGYLGTTGLHAMDYRLCDRHTDPAGASESLHTEDLLTLPDSQWCYRPYLSIPYVPIPPAAGNGFATFGSFNQFAKISPSVRRIWSKVLNQLPESRLLAVGIPDGEARSDFLGSFEKDGVDPNRIDIIGRVSMNEYYRRFNEVDIVLDTTPYTGATTTCDSLWMAVPVITLAGGHSVARSGVSLLATVGLEELVAQAPEEYVRIATDLAKDMRRLTAFRHGLREQVRRSSLMDESKFVRGIEALYRQIWAAWCADSHAGQSTLQRPEEGLSTK